MITGKNSWMYLVLFFVVLFVTIGAGICACAYNTHGSAYFGVANMVLGIGFVVIVYLKKRDKDKKNNPNPGTQSK